MRAQRFLGAVVVGVLGLAVGAGVSLAAKPKKPTPAPPPPAPSRPFDDLVQDAEPVTDLGRLVDPLFDTCDASDALAHRQCEGERAFLEQEARGKMYVAIADASALDVSPIDSTAQEVDFEIDGCLDCAHPPVLDDGKGGHVARYVTTKVPRALKGDKMLGVDLDTIQLSFPSPVAAQQWKKNEKRVVPRLRVQFIFTLGPTWTGPDGISGVTFVPLAYRVLDPCAGDVYASVPSAPQSKAKLPIAMLPSDSLVCPSADDDLTPEERAERLDAASRPESLTRELIEKTLTSVQPKIHACHVQLSESGIVTLHFTVAGATGKVDEIDVQPPFDRTPGGACVKAAMKAAKFSRFKNDKQEIRVPVMLR